MVTGQLITHADFDAAAPLLRRVPQQARSRDTLRRGLQAAAELIAHGDALTMQAIATRAGCGRSSLYNYLAGVPAVRACIEAMSHQPWPTPAPDSGNDSGHDGRRRRSPDRPAPQAQRPPLPRRDRLVERPTPGRDSGPAQPPAVDIGAMARRFYGSDRR